MAKKLFLFASMLSLSAPALADNSVIINQVDGGNVAVKQSGDGNFVQIDQEKLKTSGDNEKAKKPKNNQEVPAYLSVGDKARVDALIKQQIPPPNFLPNYPQNKGIVNTLSVEQNGKDNSSKLYQSGDDNQLLLKQDGENNKYDKSQIGKHNKSTVIQNGDKTE